MPAAALDRKLLAAVERLGRALRTARQRLATEHGTSVLGVQILEVLADGRPRRIGVLADELAVTQATLSDAVTALVARGLVDRSPAAEDRRATEVTLTDVGREVAAAIADAMEPVIGATRPGPATPQAADVDDRATADRPAANAHAGVDDRATALRVLLGEISRLHDAGIITVDRSCYSCRHYQPPGSTASAPAWCRLLDRALLDADLRVDCPEHAPAPASGSPSRR